MAQTKWMKDGELVEILGDVWVEDLEFLDPRGDGAVDEAALNVKTANKWLAHNGRKSMNMLDCRDAEDELEWLVEIK